MTNAQHSLYGRVGGPVGTSVTDRGEADRGEADRGEVDPGEAQPGESEPAVLPDVAGTTESDGAPAGSSHRATVWLHLAVFGGFVLLGVALWWRVWITGSPTSTLTCQCGDPSQGLWFLTWTPWALVHGHSPFLADAIFAGQGGANMMVNTSWMLPATVLAPVTWLFGPIASFNVAATLAPAISGWCFFVASRRVTTLVPAQVLGALLFGFSPFLLQNDPFGHLNFTLLFFPPLLFIVLHDLVVTHRRSAASNGVWLAVLVVAEFFTGTELLAMTVVVAVVTMVVAAGIAPRAAWEQRARMAKAGAVAGGIVVVVLAYPVWFIVAGPRHIVGFSWANSPQLGTSPSAILDPGVGVHSVSLFDAVGGYFGAVGPNSGPFHLPSLIYFGLPLIAFLVVSSVTWYRWRLAWALVAGTVAAWLLSFGTTLGTEGSTGSKLDHPWWAPWRLFAHLPLVSDILPTRFAVLVTFGVAMLLAISLDRWCTVIGGVLDRRATKGAHSRALSRAVGPSAAWRHRVLSGTVATAVGLGVLVPVALVEPVPFTVVSTPLPAWFADAAPTLPAGTIVLVVPFEGQRAEGWQAQTGLHFALAGGFAVVPGANGQSVFVTPPDGAVGVLDGLSVDPGSFSAPPLPSSAADVASVRSAILRWKVGVTVVTHEEVQPAAVVAFFTAVYGRSPSLRDGVWVWTGPPDGTPVPRAVGAVGHAA